MAAICIILFQRSHSLVQNFEPEEFKVTISVQQLQDLLVRILLWLFFLTFYNVKAAGCRPHQILQDHLAVTIPLTAFLHKLLRTNS